MYNNLTFFVAYNNTYYNDPDDEMDYFTRVVSDIYVSPFLLDLLDDLPTSKLNKSFSIFDNPTIQESYFYNRIIYGIMTNFNYNDISFHTSFWPMGNQHTFGSNFGYPLAKPIDLFRKNFIKFKYSGIAPMNIDICGMNMNLMLIKREISIPNFNKITLDKAIICKPLEEKYFKANMRPKSFQYYSIGQSFKHSEYDCTEDWF